MVESDEKFLSKLFVTPNLRREYFSVAPMVDVSDKYFLYLMRLLSKHATLYTQMISESDLLDIKFGTYANVLGFMPMQKPIVCQLGGNDPERLAEAAKIVEAHGFDEVNLNCGCPSSRVSKGAFGARLMFTPKLVAQIVKTVQNAVKIPVTVKCRLGVDDRDKWEEIVEFVHVVSEEGGCKKFIIHARKCHLKGLDPKQNRTIPPLKYDWVFRLAKEFPHLNFVINGGFD